MNQTERRIYLIEYLLSESGEKAEIPQDELLQKRLLRALFNVRPPKPASEEFLRVQDKYLQEELRNKGITEAEKLPLTAAGFALYKGDITTLKCDAIVNAANSAMLGCFAPNHACIDNAIHTFAGIEVRRDCAEIMKCGSAKNGEVIVTSAYNLPSKYIFHTAGPIVYGKVTEQNEKELFSCYANCLEKAADMRLKSIAFCCISTGVFGYPQEAAANVAVSAVKGFLSSRAGKEAGGIKVIFDVFTEKDYEIYRRLIG